MAYYGSGKFAKAQCSRCGLTCSYVDLQLEARTKRWVCPDCHDPQALDDLPLQATEDSQELHHPQPDRKLGLTRVRLPYLSFASYLWIDHFKPRIAVDISGAAAEFAIGATGMRVNQSFSGANIASAVGVFMAGLKAHFPCATTSAVAGTMTAIGRVQADGFDYLEDESGNVLTDDDLHPLEGGGTSVAAFIGDFSAP